MKKFFASLLVAFSLCAVFAAENVNFLSKPLTAGRASLTENGFIVSRTVGTANFSPELRLPIQLVYNSASEKTGMFGFAWSSPQLESSAYYDKDGALWTTPWGEKIKFFAKNEKTPKDAIKLELYEQAKKGRGFFAPYSDWEAATSASRGKISQSGDWTFTGKRKYQGWKFVYRDTKLRSIFAPSGRSVSFDYSKDRLTRIEQGGVAFAEFSYDGKQAVSATVNGIETKIQYRDGEVIVLPKTTSGQIIRATRPRLASLQTGNLNPAVFSYQNSFLSKIQQGDFIDELTVQTETLAERYANLNSKNRKSGVKHSGKVAGRLLADVQFKYTYSGSEPGKVNLTDKLNQTANYDFTQNTGIFKITEFSGKSYTIYYFMRYDVAYLGKVRKIVDGRGRDVVNYRYDKLSGNVLRIRDMAENDINFAYYPNGNLKLISRRAADQDAPEPITGFIYDKNNNPQSISRLDAQGKAVVTTAIQYSQNNQPTQISNGQIQTNISYNKFGYPVFVRNVFGQTQEMRFDKFNRLESATDIYGVTTSYSYTPAGQIERIERKDRKELLTSLSVTYNGNGQPISYTDQSGRTKKFERDAFGRVIKELFPDETSVEYTYNKVGQLHTVQDQNRHEICFDWNKFGLDSKKTAAGQLTDYVHDKYGMLAKVDSKWRGKTDRSIKYEYDKLDRLVKVTYSNNEVETFAYNSWGKLTESSRGNKKATFKYDYFGRMIEKDEGTLKNTYSYNPWGQRTSRITKNDGLILSETKTYDKFGRLAEIKSDGKNVKYLYNDKNQLFAQIIDNIPVEFSYTRYGQLESKILGGKINPISSLKYLYSKDGMIAGRVVDGKFQMYSYDKKGQLLQVADMQDKVAEAYKYDPAGNILSKTINGKTTSYTYDKANQLVTSTVDGKVTRYAYDAAGRMVKEGDKAYSYGYLDKILSIQENGKQTAAFDYHVDGQIANATHGDKSENFLWDGLALIHRGKTSFVNEPYVTGGNPILSSKDGLMFNDILGNSLNIGGKSVSMTAFGEPVRPAADDTKVFFTGKPYIGELGYAFLFRNYRADQGKWNSADPLGYPDGWNNLAYVNNGVIISIDKYGTDVYHVVDSEGAFAGAGHSAYIVGNKTDGYTAYDYQANGSSGSGSSGSSSDSESRTQGGFATPEAALAFLNSNRTTEHNFDKGQMWETTREEDAAAHTAAAQYMTEDYALLTHNCYDLGPDAIIDAVNNLRPKDKQIDISDGPHPNNAFDYNNNHGATRMQIE